MRMMMNASSSGNGVKVSGSPRTTPRKTSSLSLSKELPDLAKEDTKCEYCGVSYLIHSKVKSLEEKVRTLKEQLQRYETVSNIEEHLQQEHQTRVDAINQDHQKEIDDIQERYTKKIKEIQAQNTLTVTSLQSELDKKKKASKKIGMELKMVLARVMAYRLQLNQLKNEASQKIKIVAEGVAGMGPSICTRIYALKIEALEQSQAAAKAMEEANQIKHTIELQEARSTNKTVTDHIKKTQEQLTDTEGEVADLQKQIKEVTKNMKDKEQVEPELRKDMANLESANSKYLSEISLLSQTQKEKESDNHQLKSRLEEMEKKMDENTKALHDKEKDVSSHKTMLASLEKNMANLSVEQKEAISQYQYQMSEVEETTKSKIASMRSTFQEQIKELQAKESASLRAKELEFEKALAEKKQGYQTSIDTMNAKHQAIAKELESQKEANRQLQDALEEEKLNVKVVTQPSPPKLQLPEKEIDYLPLEVMERQLLKLGEIVTKKERQVTHLQMIIQQECNERAELKYEMSELKEKLNEYERKK